MRIGVGLGVTFGGAGAAGTVLDNLLAAGVLGPCLLPALSRSSGRLWQDFAKTVPATAADHAVAVAVCPYTGAEYTAPNNGGRLLLKSDGAGGWRVEADGADDYLEAPLGATINASGCEFQAAVVGPVPRPAAGTVSTATVSVTLFATGRANDDTGVHWQDPRYLLYGGVGHGVTGYTLAGDTGVWGYTMPAGGANARMTDNGTLVGPTITNTPSAGLNLIRVGTSARFLGPVSLSGLVPTRRQLTTLERAAVVTLLRGTYP